MLAMFPFRSVFKRLTAFSILGLFFVGVFILPVAAGKNGRSPDVAKGKTLFMNHCAGCHGTAGQGDGYRILGADPADFTSPSTRKKTDANLLKTIHEGKRVMPAWKVRLSRKDSQDVLAYIRTLSKQ